MTQDEMNEIVERNNMLHRKPKDKMLKVRNLLNIIFMAGAILGMVYYFSIDQNTGIVIILTAMTFKIIESAIRLLRL